MMMSWQKRLEQMKAADEERNSFVEDLVAEVRGLTDRLEKSTAQVERLQDSVENYHVRAKDATARLREFQMRNEKSAFVAVLVDGDNAYFHDNYIISGRTGGQDAARNLQHSVVNYAEKLEGYQSHWTILIQVYSKVVGLNKKYHSANIVPDLQRYHEFIQGFNEQGPFCDYIDAGEDKEGADTKIRKKMELFFDNVHCKHIILAASGDSSYKGFLRQYSLTDAVCDRITLLEALPFVQGLRDIAPKFLHVRINDVFRGTALPDSRASNAGMTYASQASRTASTSNRGQASTIPSTSPLIATSTTSPFRSVPAPKIRRNRHGQRIDPELAADMWIVNSLKPRKLCNRHFLSHCYFTSEECKNLHESPPLTDAQATALRVLARMSPCGKGVFCDDVNCVAGHRCPQDGHCEYRESCRFSRDMHGIDMVPVNTVAI